jgi:SAM-dependent methyltransferase
VDWASKNLEGLTLKSNSLEPPLPFDDASFDFVYAISVLTHLPEDLQRPWMVEPSRVIEPGGILMLTLSGEGDFDRMTEEERHRFNRGELVVVDGQYAGTNMCGIYHPPSYAAEKWGDLFRLRRRYPEGAHGSPRQDLYVFERLPLSG